MWSHCTSNNFLDHLFCVLVLWFPLSSRVIFYLPSRPYCKCANSGSPNPILFCISTVFLLFFVFLLLRRRHFFLVVCFVNDMILQKKSEWHDLTEENNVVRINRHTLLKIRFFANPILTVITGDEKWILIRKSNQLLSIVWRFERYCRKNHL